MLTRVFATLFSFLVIPVIGAIAADATVGKLEITQPTIRATPPGAKVAAGYVKIKNTGSQDDVLISVATPVSMMSHIHSMKMENGVMTMESIPGGLKVPAGESAILKPGANHLMFMKLNAAMNAGETQSVTLTFEKAGSVEVTFDVRSIGETLKLFKD